MAWFPLVFYSIIFPAAVYFYLAKKSFWGLIKATALFYFAFASLKTWFQYQLWSNTGFGRVLLESSLDPSVPGFFGKLRLLTESSGGYFFYYALSRFWFNFLATALVAVLFYFFLKLLEKRWPRFFEPFEPELGLLLGLFCGWPLFLLFLPLSFALMILFSLAMSVFFKQNRVTLGLPLLLGAALTLVFGGYLSKFISLSSLKI